MLPQMTASGVGWGKILLRHVPEYLKPAVVHDPVDRDSNEWHGFSKSLVSGVESDYLCYLFPKGGRQGSHDVVDTIAGQSGRSGDGGSFQRIERIRVHQACQYGHEKLILVEIPIVIRPCSLG
jgi:hypothetical protein